MKDPLYRWFTTENPIEIDDLGVPLFALQDFHELFALFMVQILEMPKVGVYGGVMKRKSRKKGNNIGNSTENHGKIIRMTTFDGEYHR